MHSTYESRYQAIRRLQQEQGNRLPEVCTPTKLRLTAIHTAEAVFQPREFFHESHVRTLVAAIRAQEGASLDPIVVWYSGKHWYVLDGHHRLAAYKQFNADGAKEPFIFVPVKVFKGSLAEAMCVSASGNSKNKLPMRQVDKSNMAWRLVCMDDSGLTAKEIGRSAGVSRRTIQSMRKAFKSLRDAKTQSELLDLTWFAANRLANGNEGSDWDSEADERQGAIWAGRLGHQFGKKFAGNPHAAAYALRHYSPDLPRRLLETDVFQEALEDLDYERKATEGVPDYEIFY